MIERTQRKQVIFVDNPLKMVIEAVVTNNVGFGEDKAREILTKGDPEKQSWYENFGLTPHLSWLAGQMRLPVDLEDKIPMYFRTETVAIEIA